MTNQFVSACCQGERCKCGAPAAHKVEEVIFHDDPQPIRHPLTAYLCAGCFEAIMSFGVMMPVKKSLSEMRRV